MDVQPWVDELQQELRRQRVPNRDAARLLAELTDHAHDFLEDAMHTDVKIADLSASLGTPSEIVAAARTERYRRKYLNRHPAFTFAVLPVVLMPVLGLAGILATLYAAGACVWLLFPALPNEPETYPAWIAETLRCGMSGWVILAATIVLAALWRRAQKARLNWKWPVVSCLLIAILASFIFVDAHGATPTERATIMFGVGYPRTVRQFAQLLPPLLLAGAMTLRCRRDEHRRFSEA